MPPPTGRSSDDLEMTRLESSEEIRRALNACREGLDREPKAKTKRARGLPIAEVIEVVPQTERPLNRPPLALLCILDDGSDEGEWVRLRSDVTIIGRSEGDVRIPHDSAISATHAQVVRQRAGAGYRWSLVDLQSGSGTFVRIGNAILHPDNEIIIGSGCYRFEASAAASRSAAPVLIELAPAGQVKRIALTLPEYWIGRDAKLCAIARPDDAFVNDRHARLFRDGQGQWHIENNKSLNGLWLRITEPMPLNSACQFRMGEQRFLFRVS